MLVAEVTNLAREPGARIAAGVLFVLYALALACGTQRLLEDRRLEAELARLHADELTRLGDAIREAPPELSPFADARIPAFVAMASALTVARLPPGPLAPLAIGQRDVWPTAMRMGLPMSVMREVADESFDRFENPHHVVRGPFDLTFVIVFFVPLVIIALAHDAIAADRERGVAFVLAAQNISLGRLLAARLLARFILVVSLTAMAAIAGALIAWRVGCPLAFGRALLWIFVAAAYELVWLAVCGLIQTFHRAPGTNAVIASAMWLAVVIVWPVVAELTASVVAPVPPRPEIQLAKREAKEVATAQGPADIKAFYDAHPELGPDALKASEGMTYPRWLVPLAKVRLAVADLHADLDAKLDAQERVTRWLATASPALAAFALLRDVAGQGATRHRAFLRQAEAFDSAYANEAIERTLRLQRYVPDDLSALPRFSFTEEAVSDWLWRVTFDVAAILVAVLALASWTWWRAHRQGWRLG